MSLPRRGAAVLVALSDPEGSTAFPPGVLARDTGTIISSFIPTYLGSYPTNQPDFYSYQHWFANYPDEVIVKVQQPLAGNSNFIAIGNNSSSEAKFKCPTNWKTSYNPGPPNYDPVPDPNGDIGEYTATVGEPTYVTDIAPRWHTDTAYDYSSDTGSPSPYSWFSTHGFVPEKGKVYSFFPSGFTGFNDFVGSWDITVDNLLSKVLNIETNEYEYYPFTQATTELKVTGKFVLNGLWDLCCWNDGTIVRGKVSIYSVDVTTGTLPESGDGFIGMTAEIGDTFSPHDEIDWEVTIEPGYTPSEIEIPKVSGKVTFVNDFWVTDVVPPT